jgi:hypothetical protein
VEVDERHLSGVALSNKFLATTALHLVDGKGLIAIDKSTKTCDDGSGALNLLGTARARRTWRELSEKRPLLSARTTSSRSAVSPKNTFAAECERSHGQTGV